MITIFKYGLELQTQSFIPMPLNARPISVQVQAGKLNIWAEVDTEERAVDHTFYCFGTGHPIDEIVPKRIRHRLKYVSTIQDRHFVWHIYHIPPIAEDEGPHVLLSEGHPDYTADDERFAKWLNKSS